VLSLNHPLRLYKEICMLDHLSMRRELCGLPDGVWPMSHADSAASITLFGCEVMFEFAQPV
jgi:hypothetical protein